jgi:hypothetical protein
MTLNRKRKPNTSNRRIIKTKEDIYQFERDLILSGLSPKEIEEYLPLLDNGTPVPTDPKRSIASNFYYHPKTGARYFKDDYGVQELIDKGEIIPLWEYLKLNFNTVDPGQTVVSSLNPIIFSSKGKTPPSVPYLQVMVSSSIGEPEALHILHNKTRANKADQR